MDPLELSKHPHRRFNPLTMQWVLVSPHRTQRPWQGQVEKLPQASTPTYDPNCYMCPGNVRASGGRTPDYTGTFVFDNDYPALMPDVPHGGLAQNDISDREEGFDNLVVAQSERGICRVVCFSPRHDLTISQMQPAEIRKVIDVWAEQYRELGALPFINHVQIFENRGALMGCSNPHPHGQIWASESLPNEPMKEKDSFQSYRRAKGTCLLCDYLSLEQERQQRLVVENKHFSALVPFWAVWPFETMIIGKRHTGALDELSDEERDGMAEILKRLTSRYDRLFEVSFPYSMGFHQRPTNKLKPNTEWHLHAHFYPPLLRSATVRKFMVGYEMLAEPQRDITPETAAERLRELKD